MTQIERRVFLLQAPDRARRQQPLDAERLEAVDVRAEVQLGRLDPVAVAVTREERDVACRASVPVTYGPDGAPNGVSTVHFLAVGQLRHVVQAAAADDADTYAHEVPLASTCPAFNSTSTPCAAEGWMNATSDPCAPGRGSSSIRRTPRAFSRASAARMSSTRSVM